MAVAKNKVLVVEDHNQRPDGDIQHGVFSSISVAEIIQGGFMVKKESF